MRKYQLLTQGDRTVDAVLAQEELLARIKSRSNDVADKNRNILANADAVKRWPYMNNPRYWNGGL
jgi:hypothetical protein